MQNGIEAQTPTFELNGGEVCRDSFLQVAVQTQNFSSIISIQFSVEWDTNFLALENISELTPNLENALLNTNLVDEGKMAFSWMDGSFDGVSLTDNSSLFLLNFRAKAGTAISTDIQFGNDPAPIETVKKIDGVLTQVSPEIINNSVVVYQPIVNTVVIEPEINGMDGSIDLEVTGGKEPYAYLWSNGLQTEDINNLSGGNYFCEVTDALTCHNNLGPFEIEVPTTTEELPSWLSFSIHPNPAIDKLHLDLRFPLHREGHIRLYDLLGKQWMEAPFKGQSIPKNITINHCPAGTYFLSISSGAQFVVQKIIISKSSK